MTDRVKHFHLLEDEVWFFKYGVGGPGVLVSRATPIAFPKWRITTYYGENFTAIPVEDEATHLQLLKLPRCKHV